MGKTALVLSAGGYFGAYQAGVWKHLAGRHPIDIVVGASVGALNGWAIAAKCEPNELADRWLDPGTAQDLTFRPNPGLRQGFFQAAPLLSRAERLFQDFSPVLPFGLVSVEMPWLRERLFRIHEITPRHLLASCSIPFMLPMVEIAGRRYTDGGLLEKLPLWAAVEMGATEIIAIDSLPAVTPWWIHASCRVMRFLSRANMMRREVPVTLIAAGGALGTAHDAVIWKRDNVKRWIELGERDAEHAFAIQWGSACSASASID